MELGRCLALEVSLAHWHTAVLYCSYAKLRGLWWTITENIERFLWEIKKKKVMLQKIIFVFAKVEKLFFFFWQNPFIVVVLGAAHSWFVPIPNVCPHFTHRPQAVPANSVLPPSGPVPYPIKCLIKNGQSSLYQIVVFLTFCLESVGTFTCMFGLRYLLV